MHAILERFVLGLPSCDPRKAARFEALISCKHFNANHRIVAGAFDPIPQSGLPCPVQRPIEFAICQFLAADADAAWARAITQMAVNPRFDGGFQRPLLFIKALVIDSPLLGPSLDRLAVDESLDPIIHHQQTAVFASTFLIQEAPNFDPPSRVSIMELVRSIELRMDPQPRALAAQEQFLLSSFGELARPKTESLRARLLANSPIVARASASSLMVLPSRMPISSFYSF